MFFTMSDCVTKIIKLCNGVHRLLAVVLAAVYDAVDSCDSCSKGGSIKHRSHSTGQD